MPRDTDGNECTMDVLCMREPAWAANRIRTLTEELARLQVERTALMRFATTYADGDAGAVAVIAAWDALPVALRYEAERRLLNPETKETP